MTNKYTSIMAVVVLLLAAGGGYYWLQSSGTDAPVASGPAAGGNRATVVSVATVQLKDVSDRIESVGTLVANESVTITAQVSDPVRKIHFHDGQYVEEGDVLVELTSHEESALLDEAKTNLEESELQLERLEKLGVQLASQQLIDEARARRNANKAKLDAIVARIQERLITAPFSGVLGFRQISPGTLVTTSTTITTLDDISTLNLDFSVSETYLRLVSPGSLVNATSPSYPGETFSGIVETLGSRVDPVSRTLTVRAKLVNSERRLRPGMLMAVELTTSPIQSLVIPEASLVMENSTAFVYVVDQDNKIERRIVEISQRRPGEVVIRSGLEEGEVIVLEGIDAVRPGGTVDIVETVGVDTDGVSSEDLADPAALSVAGASA